MCPTGAEFCWRLCALRICWREQHLQGESSGSRRTRRHSALRR